MAACAAHLGGDEVGGLRCSPGWDAFDGEAEEVDLDALVGAADEGVDALQVAAVVVRVAGAVELALQRRLVRVDCHVTVSCNAYKA